MTILTYILAGLVLSLLLVKSAELMIAASSKLARHFSISEYTISFLVIAFATSLPELMVGIVSALDNNPSLSYGNVLGSNIADLTIIISIPILIGGAISTKEIIKNKDVIFTMFFGTLPLVLMLDGTLSRLDGTILILGYFFYLVLVLRRSTPVEGLIEKIRGTNVLKETGIFIFSVVLLLTSADLIVKVAEQIGILANVPLILIGLTLTAIGTSLPELAFGLKAIKTHHKNEVLGNIVGSVIANSTLVLGVTSIISPISSSTLAGTSSLGFLIGTLALFSFFSYKGRGLGKVEAAILIMTYIAFVMFERFLL